MTRPKNNSEVIVENRFRTVKEREYKRPRLGIPNGWISWEKNKNDIDKILHRFIKSGYGAGIPKDINQELRQHVEYFRNNLDMYDIIAKDKVFCIDEIYFRCLSEGTSFTKFIKKSRAQSLQDRISLSDIQLDSEYIHSNYTGYDSIIHERYLIYWDDSDETIDWVYSLMEDQDPSLSWFSNVFEALIKKYKLEVGDDTTTILDAGANKKSAAGEFGKTTLLKNTWGLPGGGSAYIGERKVVPTFPGTTRDTAVPTVDTLLKLKLIHKHARTLSEKLPFSANVPFDTLNKRVQRLKLKNRYLHLDFKKYGLTFPRKVVNYVLNRLGKSHLAIKDFILVTDEGPIRTNRGGCLGWFDSLTAIAVITIIWGCKLELGLPEMDFLVFNDDVEIAFSETDGTLLELWQDYITQKLLFHGFEISHRKTFVSKEMIFLEDYNNFDDLLDMRKLQLAVKPFGKSLSSPWSWEAKIYFAYGWRDLQISQIREICQNSIEPLFEDEFIKPVELGGWTFMYEGSSNGDSGLNIGLEDASPADLDFYRRIQKYKEPHLMPAYKVVTIDIMDKYEYIAKEQAVRRTPLHYPNSVILDDYVRYDPEQLEAMSLIVSQHREYDEEHMSFDDDESSDDDTSDPG